MNCRVRDLQAVPSRTRAEHPVGYALLVTALLAVFASSIGVLAEVEGPPPVGLVLVFACLVVATENRDRLFGDETSISSSIVVAIASVLAFRESTRLLGPLLCAACAGIYWPHLRERSFAKIAVNASTIGLSALVAAGAFALIDEPGPLSIGRVALLAGPAAITYWILNTSALAAALSLLRGACFPQNVCLLVRSETPMLGFAVVGALCGLVFLDHGYVAGVMAIVSLLVVIDVLTMSARPRASRVGDLRRLVHRSSPMVVGLLLGALFADRLGTVGAASVVAVGAPAAAFLRALVRIHHLTGVWDRHLAIGMAVVDAPLIAAFGFAGVLAVAAGIWVAAASLGLTVVGGFLASKRLRRRELRANEDDHLIASAAEQAVLEGRSLPTSSH